MELHLYHHFHHILFTIFFQIALCANLVSPERASNRVDISYLFYLPFCNVFVSSDKLHRNLSSYFLRNNQRFQWGIELKNDLKIINEYYSSLPQSTKDKGIISFANYPPTDLDLGIQKLWDLFIPGWRKSAETYKPPRQNKKLVKKIKEMSEAPTSNIYNSFGDPNNLDFMSISRSVSKKKGSWFQLPKNIKPEE